jgi:hypothetical protein
LTVTELKRIYFDKRRVIRARLAEFAKVGRTCSSDTLFEELTFCIFTAGASARMGLRSVEGIRPVLMTALAMILGMLPMAFGLGEGGEQNAPLGRAVIGGLLFATLATLN